MFSSISCGQRYRQGQVEALLAGSGWTDINHNHPFMSKSHIDKSLDIRGRYVYMYSVHTR